MKRSLSVKFFAAAALAVAAAGVTSAAHARSDVYLSIGVQGAPVYYEPAPVYVQPRPVYVQPQPVYVAPQPVYRYDDGWRYRDHGHRRYARRYGPYGDLDRDGIPNQDDRDRDGDGVRNRYDHSPDNPYRY